MPPVDERTQLLRLMRLLSYRRGIVTLASGKQSDFFIDCKQTVLTAKGHALVGSLLLKALQHLPEHEAVAGVVLGGCPLASAVSLTSHLTGRPLQALYVRKEAKDHGTKRLIEGGVQRGMRVAMVEDVITTGGSTLRAVEVLQDAGVMVVGVAVLVDRLEGGTETLRQHGLDVVSLFTRHDFVDELSLASTLTDTLTDG